MVKQKAPSGGCSGLLRRFWYYICFLWVGTKWNIIELFTRHKKLDIQKIPRRQGDVAVITGGARGIGFEVLKQLLILDMHVIIGCRNERAGDDAVARIRQKGISTGAHQSFPLDLKSLESVSQFSETVLKKYRRINILINNAGIMLTPYEVTNDNFESHFQVNYLSHFLLTQLLLPKLKSSGTPQKPSRIVNVSSCAAYGGKINFEDLSYSQLYSPSLAYMTTKQMQVVFTCDLESRLKKEGANVHVYAVHPGVVKTDLYENMCFARMCGCMTSCFFKSPKQGGDCVTFAAVSPKVEGEGGSFYGNSKKISIPSPASNWETQKKLWTVSCELTGISTNAKSAQTVFSVENENEPEDAKVGFMDPKVDDADSDSEGYGTKPTAVGSPNEHHIAKQKEINNDIAKKLVDAIEDNTELAIAAISKELVDDIVGKSEDIVNSRVNLERDFIHSPSQEELLSEISSDNEIQENSNDIASESGPPKDNSNETSSQFVTNIINVVGNQESTTKEYGTVSITEIFDSNKDPEGNNETTRIPTPNIMITNASDAASDSDPDNDTTSLPNAPRDIPVTVIAVEAS